MSVAVAIAFFALVALAALLCWTLSRELAATRAEHAAQRDAWERERSQLLTRCMDPSLVPALANYDTGEVPQTKALSESEEIEAHRQTIADTIDAEMQARGLGI